MCPGAPEMRGQTNTGKEEKYKILKESGTEQKGGRTAVGSLPRGCHASCMVAGAARSARTLAQKCNDPHPVQPGAGNCTSEERGPQLPEPKYTEFSIAFFMQIGCSVSKCVFPY